MQNNSTNYLEFNGTKENGRFNISKIKTCRKTCSIQSYFLLTQVLKFICDLSYILKSFLIQSFHDHPFKIYFLTRTKRISSYGAFQNINNQRIRIRSLPTGRVRTLSAKKSCLKAITPIRKPFIIYQNILVNYISLNIDSSLLLQKQVKFKLNR